VIARINGHALGGGCELAQACDVRIAVEDAKIGQPEINLGIIPGGGTPAPHRLVGEGQAMKLILSGELIDTTEANEIGLVDEVCDAETLDDRVYELAGAMAEKSPVALELAEAGSEGQFTHGSRLGPRIRGGAVRPAVRYRGQKRRYRRVLRRERAGVHRRVTSRVGRRNRRHSAAVSMFDSIFARQLSGIGTADPVSPSITTCVVSARAATSSSARIS